MEHIKWPGEPTHVHQTLCSPKAFGPFSPGSESGATLGFPQVAVAVALTDQSRYRMVFATSTKKGDIFFFLRAQTQKFLHARTCRSIQRNVTEFISRTRGGVTLICLSPSSKMSISVSIAYHQWQHTHTPPALGGLIAKPPPPMSRAAAAVAATSPPTLQNRDTDWHPHSCLQHPHGGGLDTSISGFS